MRCALCVGVQVGGTGRTPVADPVCASDLAVPLDSEWSTTVQCGGRVRVDAVLTNTDLRHGLLRDMRMTRSRCINTAMSKEMNGACVLRTIGRVG